MRVSPAIRNLIVIAAAGGGLVHADDLDERAAALARGYRNNVAIVEDARGAGSAFIARMGKGTYLFTNQHVVAGQDKPSFTLTNGKRLRTTDAAAAVDHDIMAFGVEHGDAELEIGMAVDRFLNTGDDVLVLGNPDGAGVIHPIPGKITGIGPTLIEVSAPFVGGNSGSPIVHLNSGRVIAIAAFITVEKKNGTRDESQIRRFGFRFDSIKRWQPVRWWEFNDEHATVLKLRDRTDSLRKLVETLSEMTAGAELAFPGTPEPEPLPARPTQDQLKGHAASAERTRAVTIASWREKFVDDLAPARRRLGYDFFVHALAREERARTELLTRFDAVVKR